MDVGTGEDGAFWLAFLRSLVARGLSGVQLVTSDPHQGPKDAIATGFGEARWQRCRTHHCRPQDYADLSGESGSRGMWMLA